MDEAELGLLSKTPIAGEEILEDDDPIEERRRIFGEDSRSENS